MTTCQGYDPKQDPGPMEVIPGPAHPIGEPMDFTRPLRTKGTKTPARVIAIVHQFTRPVVVALGTKSILADEPICYDLMGRHGSYGNDFLDLEYVPEAGEGE